MAKGPKICEKCGNEYPKKMVKCPNCGHIDDRRAHQIYDLELKAFHHPEIGLRCKKCGTLYPNDIAKCPYCATAAESAGRPIIKNGIGGIFETPLTRHFGYDPHVINPDMKTKIAATRNEPVRMVSCKCCKEKISNKAETCPHCGNPTGIHICPRCSSINTKVITGTSKAASIFLWGAFAANKVVSKFECKDCGHRF